MLSARFLAGCGAIFALSIGVAVAQETDTYNAKSAETLQHTIDFLVTIALAAIAALGFIFKDSKLSGRWRWSQVISATLALLCVLTSLIFSYKSYLDLVADMGSGSFDYDSLPNNYAWSALMLLFGGAFLYITLVITTTGQKQ